MLAEAHRRITESCHRCAEDDYELIFVNDGSKDSTWNLLSTIAQHDSHVVAVNLSRNYGHQLALTAGLELANGDYVLIIDADLQDPPELLPDMLEAMTSDVDVVYGARCEREGETAAKRATAFVFYRVLNYLAEVNIPEDVGDFRLMTRRAVSMLNSMPEHHRFVRGMVSWIGLRQVPVVYHRQARAAGTTEYPLKKMIGLASDAITGFSIKPLRLATYSGFTLSICTLFLIAYALISYFTGQTVTGWTSLTLIVLTIGSMQFLTLGIISAYIGRLYVESKKRPLYIIDQVMTQSGSNQKTSIPSKDPNLHKGV